MYLFLFLHLYMFRAASAHHQEVQSVSIKGMYAQCKVWQCAIVHENKTIDVFLLTLLGNNEPSMRHTLLIVLISAQILLLILEAAVDNSTQSTKLYSEL